MKSFLPSPGFGTFKIPDDGTAEASVREALRVGYRHIDTAAVYANEAGVGRGLSEIKREEVFLTSKLWNTDRGYDSALRAFDASLERLGTDYLDLYLIHWPANRKQFGDKAEKLNADSWKALERLYREGRVRHIGLSNFEQHHIEELDWTAEIAPMVDQVELHPGFPQTSLRAFCADRNIVVEAWSPLRRGRSLEDESISAIAERYGKSSAQVVIRWVMQIGAVPLVKSVHPERIHENFKVTDFELSADEVAAISAIEGGRLFTAPDEAEF